MADIYTFSNMIYSLIFICKKGIFFILREREEMERRKLHKEMMENRMEDKKKKKGEGTKYFFW